MLCSGILNVHEHLETKIPLSVEAFHIELWLCDGISLFIFVSILKFGVKDYLQFMLLIVLICYDWILLPMNCLLTKGMIF